MKNIIFVLILSVVVAGCKKNNPEKAFLRGQLLDECSGSPVANSTIYFYQNYTPAPNFAIAEKPESILETTTTDENGNFAFWGDDYTHKQTSSKENTSIRLDQETYLFTGDLGKGEGFENAPGELVQDVGTVYSNGANLTFDLTMDTLYGTTPIDSITINMYTINFYETLSDKSSGEFKYSFDGNYHLPLYFDIQDIETQFKHQCGVYFTLWNGGNSIEFSYQNLYLDKCQSSGEIHLEY